MKRIVSAPAPLPLIPAPNNASVSTVAPHERQRRKKNVDASYQAITDMFCEREGKATKLKIRYSVQEVLKPGFQAAFLGTFAATGKSTSRRSAKLPLSPQEHKKGRLTPSSQAVEKACHCEPVRRLAWQSVGALRKHACGMCLASDLGGYAAVASILFFAALSRDYGFSRRFAPRNDRMGLSTR